MKSIAVCASKKYKDQVKKFCDELSSLGVLVFEPSIQNPIFEDEKIGSEYVTSIIFKGLTLEHFDWIRKADACMILNFDDYVGTSVTMELAFASALSKPIFALSFKTGDPCRNALIDKAVTTPEELVKFLK